MTIYKRMIVAVASLFLSAANIAFANNEVSTEFFASNNTKEINVQTAYARLVGKEQADLQKNMIFVLHKNHIEQGSFEDILGAYRMSSDKNITADNTKHFTASSHQNLPEEKIVNIAKELAITLNQESVAVLMPDQTMTGEIILCFTSQQPNVSELLNTIHEKLPLIYNQAFSLHLVDTQSGFDNAKVAEIEWLGNKINLADIKKAFPNGKINSHYGKVFLVYKNGKKEQL